MFFSFFKRQIRPYDSGYLPPLNGHEIFYHQFGNPNGKIILSFHGGPGGCSKEKHASHFDLKKYRIILFDQRGCGKSLYKDRLAHNTTHDSIMDAIRVLEHLGIGGKIIIAGGSWGSTLALLFAQKYPERVSKLIVNSIFLAGATDLEWMSKTSRLFYPDFLDKFNEEASGEHLSKYTHKLLQSKKKKDNEKALRGYGSYEKLMGSVDPKLPEGPFTDTDMSYPSIFFHYDSNEYFLKYDQILKECHKIAHIPTFIFHNRLDMNCPIQNAWDLHKALAKSKLYIIPSHGHGSKLMFDTMKEVLKEKL